MCLSGHFIFAAGTLCRIKVTAPVSEVSTVVSFFLAEFQFLCIGTGELGETEEFSGSCFTGVIDPGNAQPHMTFLLHQKEMPVVVITVEQETVVRECPEFFRKPGKV